MISLQEAETRKSAALPSEAASVPVGKLKNAGINVILVDYTRYILRQKAKNC